jgi:predicted DNA-binding protein
MLKTTIYLTREQHAQLNELQRKTRVPVAEYIREGIDRVLRSAHQMGQLGAPIIADKDWPQ